MEDKIINRVRKMLNLAKDSAASEGERDNALRMAYATLAKHNLSMAQVEIPEEKRTDEKVRIRTRMWMVTVNNSVAKLFFCNLFMAKRGQYIDMTYVGKEGNITTAKELAEYLCASILREGKETGFGQADLVSFNKGAAQCIWTRCQALRAEAEAAPAQGSAGTSVVLASLYRSETAANDDHIRTALGITLSDSKTRKATIRTSAFRAGQEFGSTLNLHRQVGQKKSTTNYKSLAS